MRNRLTGHLLAFLLFALAAPATAQPAAAPDSAAVVQFARQHVRALTAPEMAGRGYRRSGAQRAGKYLRRQFQELGLQPVNGSYAQRFRLRADVFPEAPSLVVDGEQLELGRTFLPLAATASGEVESAVPVVTVDHGLVLPEQDLDAYEGRRVQGKVVVIDSAVPDSLRRSDTVPAQALSRSSRLQHAAAAGARAVVWLTDRLSLSGTSPYDAPVPAFQVLRTAWSADARRVRFRVTHRRDQSFAARNVMGRLKGTAQPDSVILITAHYDHVGGIGDSLYFPGANDNASGVAMLLALARHFVQHPPRKTLLFVAFSGEEIGLVGSRYFAAHPPIAWSRAAFVLNFDMVASGEEGITAVGGKTYERAFHRLQEVGDSLQVGPLSARPNAPNSDHYFITQRGVPGFFLYTKEGTQPYHHVEDMSATLEWEDFWQVFRLAVAFINRL